LVLSTAALNFVQLLVSAESMWGTARAANVFNGAGCISLLLTSHCCWLLAAQVFAVTPWSTKSGIGKLYRIINRPGHGSWPKRTFAALLVCSLVGSVVSALLQVVAGQAPSPSFKLCIYLSFPGFGGLLAALMLTAHGGLDPLGPTLSFGMAPLLALIAGIIEVTEPPALPDHFDADALSVALLLAGLIGSAYGMCKFTARKRRRFSLQEGLLAGADSGLRTGGLTPDPGNVKGTAARAELAAALGRIRRSSLADLLWLNGSASPSEVPPPPPFPAAPPAGQTSVSQFRRGGTSESN
jgi:hypothetical protein